MSKKKAVVIGAGVNGLVLSNYLQKNNYETNVIEVDAEEERQYIELTNHIGNSTLYPESDNYYMGDNIPGKPRATLFWFGGFPCYRKQCRLAREEWKGFAVGSDDAQHHHAD